MLLFLVYKERNFDDLSVPLMCFLEPWNSLLSYGLTVDLWSFCSWAHCLYGRTSLLINSQTISLSMLERLGCWLNDSWPLASLFSYAGCGWHELVLSLQLSRQNSILGSQGGFNSFVNVLVLLSFSVFWYFSCMDGCSSWSNSSVPISVDEHLYLFQSHLVVSLLN